MSDTKPTAWASVIGLEVHCQLATRSKLFCACASAFGAAPNTLVCPVCLGAPGALPVLNRAAVRLALRAGLALGCTIDRASRFDRKNYFYCDLPKGYQITQYARPIAVGGGLELPAELGGRTVRLRRIHLEEDAGKAIHDRGDATLVDLNRAGVPLIEIVCEPDLATSQEAHAYLSALKEVLQYAGVSECDMEKGSLRCDVNVSLHRPGTPLGTRVELKNLNSFRYVVAAIEHEVARQRALLERGELVQRETRLWDAERGETRPMRSKEEEEDYRYFPDPDLAPALLAPGDVQRERAALPELPAARRERWQRELALSAYDAGVLSASRELADFFEATVHASGLAKESANWIANDVLAALADPALGVRSLAESRLTPARLAELVRLAAAGELTRSGARELLRALFQRDGAPAELVAQLGLARVADEGQLVEWCRAALAGQSKAAADVRNGELKALGALMGPVMKASRGRADPRRVQETLLRLIREGAS